VLVSSIPEVEWDETEQGWMLALSMRRETRCPSCGGDLTQTTAAENEDRYRHELPLQCHRCVAFARAHEAYADQPRPHTFLHLVSQVPTSERSRT
jgi:hypothetical protein